MRRALTKPKSQRAPDQSPGANAEASRKQQQLVERFRALGIIDDEKPFENFGPWAHDVKLQSSSTSPDSSNRSSPRPDTDYHSIDRSSNHSTPRTAAHGQQSGDDAPSRQSSGATSYGMDSWEGSGGWSSDASSNRPSPRASLRAQNSASDKTRPTSRPARSAARNSVRGGGGCSNNRSGPARPSNSTGSGPHNLMRRRGKRRGEKDPLDAWVTDIETQVINEGVPMNLNQCQTEKKQPG